MSDNEKMMIEEGVVVTMDYSLRVDGDLIEDSEAEEGEALTFLQGSGQILPALEAALLGMRVGDRKEVTLAPEDGYGVIDPEAYEDFDRSDFPEEVPVEVGTELVLKDEDDMDYYAVIDSIKGDVVRLNYNHELAGKTLNFNIHITGLRQPTEEELEHGHVHFGDEDEDEYEDE